MRLVGSLSWVFAVLGLLIGGCQEVGMSPETIQVRFAIKENFEQTPIEGATICETDTANCATTDANGSATLDFPADEMLSYTVESEGYEGLLYPLLTGSADANHDVNLNTDAWLAGNFANLQAPYPMTDRGTIYMVLVPRFAGATFELIGATGTPFYLDEAGSWSPDLEATTSVGMGCCAVGGFVEVVPGEYEVEVGGTAQNCAPQLYGDTTRAWPGDDRNRFLVPVREGLSTRTILGCAEAP